MWAYDSQYRLTNEYWTLGVSTQRYVFPTKLTPYAIPEL